MSSELVLLGGVVPIDEVDDATNLEVEIENENDAFFKSHCIDIKEAIGKENFKEIYTNLIGGIKERSFEDQAVFCNVILERIYDVYNFEFPENIDLTTWETINNIYSFLEFLEYDHIKYFASLWKDINVDLRKIDIRKYSNLHKENILLKIDNLIDTYINTEQIIIFLRTYYETIDWFIIKTIQSKMMIVLEITIERLEEK